MSNHQVVFWKRPDGTFQVKKGVYGPRAIHEAIKKASTAGRPLVFFILGVRMKISGNTRLQETVRHLYKARHDGVDYLDCTG